MTNAEYGSRWSRETRLAQDESNRALGVPTNEPQPATQGLHYREAGYCDICQGVCDRQTAIDGHPEQPATAEGEGESESSRPAQVEGHWPVNDVRRIFVEGAKWWEFHSTGGTMWQSDRQVAEDEADKRFPCGIVPPRVNITTESNNPKRDAEEKKLPLKVEQLVLSIATNQFTVPLPTGKEVIQAVNAHAALVKRLTTIADQADRASLVQDRSVGIIKQVCALIAKDARAALAALPKDKE